MIAYIMDGPNVEASPGGAIALYILEMFYASCFMRLFIFVCINSVFKEGTQAKIKLTDTCNRCNHSSLL